MEMWAPMIEVLRNPLINAIIILNLNNVTFYAPPPESGGVLCYTLRNFECPSVRLSVRPSPQIGFRGLQGLDKSPLKYIGFIPLDS